MSEFLAEARVLIHPDTTRFRAELETQLRGAASKPLVIPVVAGGSAGATTALSAAQKEATVATLGLASAQEVENSALARGARLLDLTAIAATEDAAAQQAAGAATQKAAVSASALARQQSLAVTAAKALAISQSEVAGAASAVGAAQVTLSRSTAAVAAAERALGAALTAKNIALIDAASQSVRLANAQALEAETALAAARAQAVHAGALGQVQKAGFASGASLLGLRGAVLTAGTGFLAATVGITAFAKAVQSAAELEEELNVFRVTAGATADEMERVSAAAQQLGRDITLPGVTAGNAAVAMTELAKAGLSVQDSLEGARGVLQLATAAQIDNVQATELVANSLNAFALGGEEAVRVADLLTGASNEAQGSIADMGLALKQSAAVASLAGLSIDETVVILTQLAQAGLSASDAGTSLRTALTRLIGDFPKVQGELAKLNITLRDAQGNIRPEVFNEIGVALERLSPAARQQALAILGGSDAIRAFGILSRRTASDTALLTEAVTEQGLAAELAGARTSGFSGDVENLKNQMSALGLSVGQLAIPPLTLMVTTLGDVADALNETVTATRDLIKEAAGLGQPFADAIPFLDEAEGHIGDIISTAAKFQILGPTVTIASLALDKFGDSAEDAAGKTSVLDGVVESVTGTFNDLINSIKNFQGVSRPTDAGLNVQQVLNRVTGFDSAEIRARIRGDTNEILSVLQEEQAFLESQLQRDFVKRRPALQRQLENALLGTVNDIASIQKTGAASMKTAVDDAARAQRDADQALLDLFSNRRDDAQRKIAAASETEGLQDDIQSQNRLQALIKQQIRKIRDRIKNEQARKAAIRELRLALISSRAEEDALRAQQRADAQARIDTVQELNIAIAQETGNDAALARAINARITRLNKQIKAAKGDQVKVKELILERERLKNQLDELTKQEKETGKSARDAAAAFFFEQLQAQQGFASNLMGNLITGPTAGLVGVPSPTTPGRGIAVAAAVQEGKRDGGPTSGQASTTNDILLRILQQLRTLNGSYDAPEAINQKKSGGASMDYATM